MIALKLIFVVLIALFITLPNLSKAGVVGNSENASQISSSAITDKKPMKLFEDIPDMPEVPEEPNVPDEPIYDDPDPYVPVYPGFIPIFPPYIDYGDGAYKLKLNFVIFSSGIVLLFGLKIAW